MAYGAEPFSSDFSTGVDLLAPPSANVLSGNNYQDMTSSNVSPLVDLKETFIEMAYDIKSIARNTYETTVLLSNAIMGTPQQNRDEGIDKGETDDKGDNGDDKSGFFSGLKIPNPFKDSQGLGDLLKVGALVSGLLLLSKYSDKILPVLAKTLKYFKEDLVPMLEGLFVDDETGEIKWKTILGMGLGAYVLSKMIPLLLTGLVFKVGGMLTIGKLVTAGKAFGPAGLALWAFGSLFTAIGDAMAAKDWTKDAGATDNSTINAIGGFFGGQLEGGIMNAFKQAGKFAGMGALTGFALGGPVGALIGGILGAAFGGIMGFIGGGKIAQGLEAMVNGVANMWNKVTQSITDIFFDREIADGPAGMTRTQRSSVGEIYDKAALIGANLFAWVNDTFEYLTGWIPSIEDLQEVGGNVLEYTKGIINDIKNWFWDPTKPSIIGIDMSVLAEALPSIEEIKQNIMDMLPEFMKPKTEAEKQQIQDLSEAEESGFFDKDYAGYSEIDKRKIADMSNAQLQAVLDLEGDDLRPKDINIIEDELKSRGIDPTAPPMLSTSQNDFIVEKLSVKDKNALINERNILEKELSASIVTDVANDKSVKIKQGDNVYTGVLAVENPNVRLPFLNSRFAR